MLACVGCNEQRGAANRAEPRRIRSFYSARVVSMYPDLVKHFKRYQIAPVWRAERPQKGRYREFYQCDVDIVGSTSMLADAEVIGIAFHGLRQLGFASFRILLNNRKLLRAI